LEEDGSPAWGSLLFQSRGVRGFRGRDCRPLPIEGRAGIGRGRQSRLTRFEGAQSVSLHGQPLRFLRLRDTLLPMSAFACLLHLDGRPCQNEVVSAMLERLKHRVDPAGWDARRLRCQGPVGFGYAPLASTPQARFEREHPDEACTLARGGRVLWISGHIRLDNRAQIADDCRVGSSDAQRLSDGRLVLEAYDKWGEETPCHLRGDFAFGLWDKARRRLFVARDRFGTRPFYFAFRPGAWFACANEIKALWAVPGLVPRVEEVEAVAYLLAQTNSKERTFYRGVRRLAPASYMTLDLDSPNSPRPTTYWALDSGRESSFGSDEEAALALRATFFDSVRERTRSEGDYSVFLSGGLDSSSIAATAPRVASQTSPVRALSTVYPRFPGCDESRFIEDNLAYSKGALFKEWLVGDDLSALYGIERVLWHLDGPPIGPNTCSAWAQYPLLRSAGSRVVLDGHGGDEVVCMGYERVQELLRAGETLAAWRELRLLRRHGVVEDSIWPLIGPLLLRQARGTRGIGRVLSLSARFARGNSSSPSPKEDPLDAPMMAMLRGAARDLLEPPPSLPIALTVREEHARTLDGALQTLALEGLDAMAGAHAVEVRMPFWEQNMVELCLSLPSDQKMRDGFNRYVMRRAMEGFLPPSVGWRTGKTNFAPQIVEGLRRIEKARIDSTLARWQREGSALGEWVDLARMGKLWQEFQGGGQGDEVANQGFTLWRAFVLGLWLERAAHPSPSFEEHS